MILEGCFNQTMYRQYGLNSQLAIVNCDKPGEMERPFDLSDYFMILVLLGLFASVVIGTYFDICQRRNKKTNNSVDKGKKMIMNDYYYDY